MRWTTWTESSTSTAWTPGASSTSTGRSTSKAVGHLDLLLQLQGGGHDGGWTLVQGEHMYKLGTEHVLDMLGLSRYRPEPGHADPKVLDKVMVLVFWFHSVRDASSPLSLFKLNLRNKFTSY